MTDRLYDTDAEIIVVGAGLSGLLAALALSDQTHGAGRSVTVIDAGDIERTTTDLRATALTPSAVKMMSRLGVSMPDMTPMRGMRVGEGDADTPWMFELGSGPSERTGPLAYVVQNTDLRAALLQALEPSLRRSHVTLRSHVQLMAFTRNGRAQITLNDGSQMSTPLVVACDGRNSALRRLAGLSVSTLDFHQSALVATVHHKEPHEGIALQRFQRVGAVASLPLADRDGHYRSQIIWSDRTIAVSAARALPTTDLASLIDARLWNALEINAIEGDVQTFPLSAQRCEALSVPRLALVGDAARTIHPLAGQGFNLAVRDIAALTSGIRDAARTGEDIGTSSLIGYDRWRRPDEALLSGVTAALAAAPTRGPGRIVGHLRRAAFATIDAAPLIHPLLRQEALGETGTLPDLLA